MTDNDDLAAKLLRVVTHPWFVSVSTFGNESWCSIRYRLEGGIWNRHIVENSLSAALDAFLEAVSDDQ